MFGLSQFLFGSKTNFKQLVKDGALIIDVRSPQEFKAGHINGAKNIPLEQVRDKIAELKRTGKTIITVCRSGARSGIAQSILSKGGLDAFNGGSWNGLEKALS